MGWRVNARYWFVAGLFCHAPFVLGVDNGDLDGSKSFATGGESTQYTTTSGGATSSASDQLLVFLKPGEVATDFAARNQLTLVHGMKSDANAYVFKASSASAATGLLGSLKADASVLSAYSNNATAYTTYAFTPNDTYFAPNSGYVGHEGQWHLQNSFTPGLDARVTGAWNRNVTGSGVIIGIVDDSFQTTHPDLAPNYVAADSFNFGSYVGNGAANDPNPFHNNDRHGTAVAGVAAAKGGNNLGVTGAAPNAGLAGLRVDFPQQTDAMFVDATLYHSSGANTNIDIKNHSYGISSPYIDSAATSAAVDTSTAAGTIHVFSAGNDRGFSGQDANKKDDQNNPNVIAVAALGFDGLYSFYSNFGANVFVTAPTSGVGIGITTTDRTGALGYNGGIPDQDYTDDFGGTSSSAPLVAGVLALVKEVQPLLDTRFAKHLLAKTSDVVDAMDATLSSDGGWRTNAAGYKFNQNYGFGLIDADELTLIADDYSGVTALVTESTGLLQVGAVIPDNNLTGISRSFSLNSTLALEEVLVTLDVDHTFRGNLEAYLSSPSGYSSRLMIRSNSDSGDNLDWTYTTNAFWGENPFGDWTLTVRDLVGTNVGFWNAFSVTARMGELVLATPPQPTVIPEPVTAGMVGLGALFLLPRRRRAA